MKVTYTALPGKAEAHYGVTRWANAQEINQSLKELTDKNIYSIPEESIPEEEYKKICSEYYDVKCAKSKEITAEAKKYIPGGVQHNLAFNKPFPMCMTKAEGAYLTDIDGNKYIDFLQAGGPTILGSNFPAVQEEAIKLIKECGPVTGLFHEAELLIAKEINKHMPYVEKFRMLGSGTESVMAAIRIARCATKKKRVIKIGGAYHGWSDQMVYGLKVPGTRQFLESFGIPNVIFSVVDEVRPNDLNMLEDYLKLNKLRGGTAAVIVEPVGPESGTRPVDWDYNKGVRALCDKYGCIFIFDEVVTGFRVGLGGAQGLFDVRPDLTIFGKIVAGGYPAAGGVGGRRDLVDLMAAGVAGGAKKAYVGGTLAANPLSAMAGYVAIKEIAKNDACVKAGRAGDRLTDGLVKDRKVRSALCRVQPRLDRPPRMHGCDELRLLVDEHPQAAQRAQDEGHDHGSQRGDGAHGCGVYVSRHRHPRRQQTVHLDGGHRRSHRRRARQVRPSVRSRQGAHRADGEAGREISERPLFRIISGDPQR